MNKLISLVAFSILFSSLSFDTAYGGPPTEAVNTWIGTGDDQSWSDPNNWNRVGGLSPQGQAVPDQCDIIIIDDGTNAVTVHFDLAFFDFATELQIGSDDTLIIDEGKTLSHQGSEEDDDFECEEDDETIVNNGNLIIFGTLINSGQFINNGQVTNCGTISGTVSIPGIVNECPSVDEDVPVGGTLIPIDSTSLLLVGTQLTVSWLIPVLVSVVGIGLALVRRK